MRVEKPWGYYECLDDHGSFVVKTLWVNPKQRLSLQSHSNRSEQWICVSGCGLATVGFSTRVPLECGTILCIKPEEVHRLANTDNFRMLVIVEIQTGSCYEDDIIRYSDDYGRAD